MVCQKSTVFTNTSEKLKRDHFRDQLNLFMKSNYSISATKPNDFQPMNECYLISIKKEPENIKKDLLVFEQFEFDTISKDQKDLVNRLNEYSKNHEKHFPFGGIVLNLDYIRV